TADPVEQPASVESGAVGALEQRVDRIVGPRVEAVQQQAPGGVQGGQVGAGDGARPVPDRGEASAHIDGVADLGDGVDLAAVELQGGGGGRGWQGGGGEQREPEQGDGGG